ncbi:MAG: VTC domain-containing protein, partial [Acidimicrobiia bacterium]|nr:VTC domain-containing protein [Acidimicrobiia bacterium]
MSRRSVNSEIPGTLSGFEPIGLDAVMLTADLQTRKDRKYLVPIELLPELLSSLHHAQVLTIGCRNRFAYRTTYFDTPGLDSYLDAARRRPSRYKVRTRNYLDSGLCMLEVKTRDRRGRTVKRRLECDPDEELGFSWEGEA